MKKSYKSLIASVLAIMMIFSLAACGGGNEGSSATPGGIGNQNAKSGRDGAPQFAYVSSFREVKNDTRQPINAVSFTDKGFYTTSSDVIGQREPEEGEELQWEGQFDIVEERLYFETFDGQRSKLENYEPFAFTPAEGHEGSGELMKLASDAQGNLAAVYHSWEYWYDAPE